MNTIYNDAKLIFDFSQMLDFSDNTIIAGKLAWEITGNCMNELQSNGNPSINAIQKGDIVYSDEIAMDHLRDHLLNDDRSAWIIVGKHGVIFRMIITHDIATGEITCQSLNNYSKYQDIKLNLDEVYKLFKLKRIETALTSEVISN